MGLSRERQRGSLCERLTRLIRIFAHHTHPGYTHHMPSCHIANDTHLVLNLSLAPFLLLGATGLGGSGLIGVRRGFTNRSTVFEGQMMSIRARQ